MNQLTDKQVTQSKLTFDPMMNESFRAPAPPTVTELSHFLIVYVRRWADEEEFIHLYALDM